MKIYFEVPYGYRTPDINGEEVSIVPHKGDYMDVITEVKSWVYSTTHCNELQVRKICFNDKFTEVTITLAEED